MRVCAYSLMPNHWHFVLWPENDGDLAAFMQKLTVTHVRNWQVQRRKVGADDFDHANDIAEAQPHGQQRLAGERRYGECHAVTFV